MKLTHVLLGLLLFSSVAVFARAEDDAVVESEPASEGFSDEENALRKESEETYEFQAEVNRLMDIIINSLYSNREIFVRELISNAADALDKIRFQSLTDKDVLGEGDAAELDIRISYDKEAKSLTFTDKGVGMTKEELIKNLGVVANSGTTEFVEAAAGGTDSLSLIGQFGVGFYSVYLVADKVTVVSKANDDKQHIWESTANSVFTIAEDPRGNTLGRGTSVTLHLKEDAEEFLNESELEKIVGRYSEFINFPIYLRTEKIEEKEVPIEEDEEEAEAAEEDEATDEEDDDLEVSEDEEEDEEEEKPKTKTIKETIRDWKLLNAAKAIWTRSPREITEDEYENFYKSLTKATEGPLDHIHFVAEGEITFRSILFIPKKADAGLYDKFYEKSTSLKLYVRRVLIADEFDDFLPRYLNFIKGVVDSEDLPLNVSRETLAQSRVLKVMSKKLTRKVLEMLRKMAERSEEDEEEEDEEDEEDEEEGEEASEDAEDAEGDEEIDEGEESAAVDDYKTFWENFGKSIKLGIMDDRKNKSKLAKLLRYTSTTTNGELTSFEGYVDRMHEDQKYIYYITGESLEQVKASPMLERLTAKNLEVLFMVDPLDEYVVQMVTEFDGHTLQSVAKSGLKVGDEDEDLKKKLTEKYEPLTTAFKDILGAKVADVEISNRLAKTPCVIVTGQYGWGANMRRIMNAQTMNSATGTDNSMYGRKTLEINTRHPILRAMADSVESENHESDEFKDLVHLLFDGALAQSGFPVEEPAEFAARLNRVVAVGLGTDPDAPMAEDDDLPEEEEEEEEEEAEAEEEEAVEEESAEEESAEEEAAEEEAAEEEAPTKDEL
jgi:heat shock protein beta